MYSKLSALLRKAEFYFATWTGRILLINFALFILITFYSGSLFAPQGRVLITWGAKDPVSIALGDWWRLITPIFLHFGILHFGLNGIALKVIGTHLEPLVGSFWFLLIYLGSGIAGNVLSSCMNVSVGAGASGAIFGLIGLGVVIERVVMFREGEKFFKLGPFTYMTILNIAIALAFNFVSYVADGGSIGIDNAAHLGGLFGGILLGSAMLCLKPNRLLSKSYLIGIAFLSLFGGSLALGTYYPLFTPRIYQQLVGEADGSSEPIRSYYFYTQAMKINSSDPQIRFKRGRIVIRLGDIHYAMPDLIYSSHYSSMKKDFENLYEELQTKNQLEEADAVKSLLETMKESI